MASFEFIKPDGLGILILAIALGAVFGSFLTCALYRAPRKLSLWSPPSACPRCHTHLGALDLIPVFSWVFSGGKCRHCHTNVPKTYLLTECYSIGLAVTSVLIVHALETFYILFVPLYGSFMALTFVLVVLLKWQKFAYKSVAFGLLCLGVFITFVCY